MDPYDKYKALKNFIHNELGITREDIEAWVKETIKGSVETHVKHLLADGKYVSSAVVAAIESEVRGSAYGSNSFRDSITKLLTEELRKQLDVSVTIRNSNGYIAK